MNDIDRVDRGFDWNAAVLRDAHVLVGISRSLAGDVARLAGDVATTEEKLAAVLDDHVETRPERREALRDAAQRARRFAAHERREQERWQRVCDTGQRPSGVRASP